MTRGQRTAFETAVSGSPLFRLPLELRTMVYEKLLIQEGGMSIPNDVFKRVRAPRRGSRPVYCGICTAVFSNDDDHTRHRCLFQLFKSDTDDLDIPNLPATSTSLLRVCRLIHLEALPILYTKNAFYFGSPATAHAFLWKSNRTQAVLIQELIITLAHPDSPDLWWEYIKSKTGLGQDFPHLRRMIINLKNEFELASAAEIRPVFQSIAESVRDLDWVHINRLNNEKLLDYLKPMVSRYNGSQVLQRQVQSHVTECSPDDSWRPKTIRWTSTGCLRFVGWKNATLWCGTSESRAPYKRRQTEPSRHRKQLFRLGSGDDDAYSAGSSFL